MSGGTACSCPESKKPVKDRKWRITAFKSNNSAFSGYRSTPSDYSAICCLECGRRWRTNAKYVDHLSMGEQT